ncbi:MAG: hypothetical protein WCX10_08340 [Bacteroidales bacterium]
MNVLDVFKDGQSIIEYFGKSDLSAGYFVKNLLDSKAAIIEYFDKANTGKIDINYFIDFNWISNVLQAEEIIPFVADAKREDFKGIIEYVKKLSPKYSDKSKLIPFISSEYKQIFDKNTYVEQTLFYHRIVDSTFKFIFGNHEKFGKEIFDYLETNYAYLILENLSECEAYYDKHKTSFCQLFEIGKNKHFFDLYNFPRTFGCLINSKLKFVKKFAKERVDSAIQQVIEIGSKVNSENYLETYSLVDPIIKIVKQHPDLRTVDFYKVEKLEKEMDLVSKEYFEKYGQKVDFGPIELKPLLEKLKSDICQEDDTKSFCSFLTLTHSFADGSSTLTSGFSKISFGTSNDPLESMDVSPNTDSYFTASSLVQLHGIIDISVISLLYILKDKQVEQKIFAYIKAELEEIDKKEGNNSLDLYEMFSGVYPYIKKWQSQDNNHLSAIDRYEIYSVTLFLSTMIEKILRKVMINRNSENMYFSEENLSLGNILQTKNNKGVAVPSKLSSVFDEELIKVLEYYLVKTQDTHVGLNIRNNYAHNNNIIFTNLANRTPMILFFLFLCVINGIHASYLNHNNRFKGKTPNISPLVHVKSDHKKQPKNEIRQKLDR